MFRVIRLLECLQKPADSRILGHQIVREIVYRVLQSEQGGIAGISLMLSILHLRRFYRPRFFRNTSRLCETQFS